MAELAAEQKPPRSETAFRVLVVDDDPDMTAFLAALLRKQGIEVGVAGDGNVALARVAEAPPDLMLLDVMMPGPTGFEICKKLKSDHATALMPIVLVTALEDKESRVKGIEAGADDFLSKPVNPPELLARVQTLRRLHETRRELESRRQLAQLQRKEAIRKAFSRYISPRLADRIIQDVGVEGGPFNAGAQRSNVVVVFVELRGFAVLIERNEAADVVAMLNECFAALTEAAYHYDGTVLNMTGESMLVGFNVPFLQSDAASRALSTAKEMLGRFGSVGLRREQDIGTRLSLAVGICMGEAVIGNVGSPHYLNYTAIGEPVDTAAQLARLAGANEVLACGRVHEAVRGLLPAGTLVPRDDAALQGRSGTGQVFAVRA
ncbi:MAG TPA: response regulator [Burkholderiales bacterium]|nr:response regulator [Burkholderiales bacterium]